jgi:AIPR protein
LDNSEFIAKVSAEMSEIGSERGIPNIGDQFAVWFASEILKEDLAKVVDTYHIGGSGDDKVDIGICDEDHEVRIVAQCKFTEKPLETTFNKDLIDEVLAAENRLATFPTSGSSKRREFAELYNQSEDPERLVAVGFGRFVPSAVEYATVIGVEVYDFEKLKKRYGLLHAPAGQKPPEFMEFPIAHGRVADTTEEYKVITFLAGARKLGEYVGTFGDSLFQENLRYRLEGAAKSRIGDKIEATVKDKPKQLEILNNGITVVARSVVEGDSSVRIYGPQIVNGGQTCWAIHDALEDLRMEDKLGEIDPRIMIRAIESTNPELTGSITSATNTQNAITERDKRSADLQQQELAHAFDSNNPKILYEFRDGLFGAVERQGKSSLYRVTGETYRTLDNEFCGQLYLALMGLPNKSKGEKQMIMQNDNYYKTIYHFELARESRFNNDVVGIVPDNVRLRTGTSRVFVEDVLFAHGCYNLAHAIGQQFRHKLDFFDNEDKRKTPVYENLLNYEFMKAWEYYIVAAVNYVVERLKKDDDDRTKLRNALVGTNINPYWRSLIGQFSLNRDLESYVVLDEKNPSPTYPLFEKWATQIALMLAQQVSDLKKVKLWQTPRKFLDLSDTTYPSLVTKLEEVLGGPSLQKNQVFPIPS